MSHKESLIFSGHIKKWKDIGKINFNIIFCLTKYIKILLFQHIVNIEMISEMVHILFSD